MMKTNPIKQMILLASHLTALSCAAGVQVGHLRCEYRENPLGLDEPAPRLSWQLVSPERGQRQTAYRILVASSADKLAAEQGDLWDSGKVESDQSILVRYAGPPPAARQTCHWKVQVWDKDGNPGGWSPAARWETGLPSPEDWEGARWIGMGGGDTRTSPLVNRMLKTSHMDNPRSAKTHPSPLFRREFELKPGVVRARAYVCGLGYHELYINGQRSGDAVLEPGQTTYDVRAFYVVHDLAPLLKTGTNAAGFMLGNGFFGQNLAFNAPGLGYGKPALLAKIVVDYADGSTQTIGTDASWRADTSPVLFDNVYGGETYDARLEQPGWNKPGFPDAAWHPAQETKAPAPKLVAQSIPPIRRMQYLPVKQILPGENGAWIFDLGQNIAGWAKIRPSAPAGTLIELRHAEILAADGKRIEPITTGLHATGMEQVDVYVCNGGGNETWEPRFTYHGFRYVEVAGLPAKPAPDFLEGVLVRSDVEPAGSFECSDELLNRIYRTSLWTIEDNLHSVIEDCPHREKCAWLGDAHVVGETTLFNYDMATFWTKFVDDIETTLGQGGVTYWQQNATPGIPCNIAVGRRLCQEARPDWGAAYILQPWYLQRFYGDADVFARHYPHLQRWIGYVKGLRVEGIVVRGYGDWCPPGGNPKMECPPPLTSTAFFYGTLNIMAGFAQQLGKTADAAEYAQLAAETKAAFNQTFWNPATGGYGSQTADAVALRFGLAPDGQEPRVAAALRREVEERHGGHAFVGIHGARPLYTELCEHGHEDVAFAALRKESFPSFAHTLEQGMTTWPEVFDENPYDGGTSGRSLNHPMQSGFAAWFHECVGGIQPAAPGFKQIVLKPHGHTQLEWAKAAHDSPYGPIASQWRSADGTFEWTVGIPPNTTATVFVPATEGGAVLEGGAPAATRPGIEFIRQGNGRAEYRVQPGTYTFTSAWPHPNPAK